MNTGDTPAGVLRLQPGRPPPNIASTRPALAAAIARGLPASALPELLRLVFALCGGAHRVTAQAAIAAAGGPATDQRDEGIELLPDSNVHGAGWLRRGALPLGPGEGLAWCEMARGLLMHRVQLDDPGVADPHLVRCDVLAPTEWNFHPTGPVARAFASLPDGGDDVPARLVAAAFDPCVAVRIEQRDA